MEHAFLCLFLAFLFPALVPRRSTNPELADMEHVLMKARQISDPSRLRTAALQSRDVVELLADK
jgi:hypothetical protein